MIDVLTQKASSGFPELRRPSWGSGSLGGDVGITALDQTGKIALSAPSAAIRSNDGSDVAPVAVLNLASRTIRGRLAVRGLPTSLALSSDGTRAVVGLSNGTAELWAIPLGGQPVRLDETKVSDDKDSFGFADVTHVAFSPDGSRLVANAAGTAIILDAHSFAVIAKTTVPHDRARTIGVSYETDGVHFYVSDGRLATWTGAGSLAYGRTLDARPRYPSAFAIGGAYVVGGGGGGTLRIARTSAPGSIDMAFDSNGEWIAFTPDGFFDGSKGGTSLVTAAVDLRAFDPMQLAPRLARPDIIFERMGFGPKELIDVFRKRRAVQLLRLGLIADLVDRSAVSPPGARIVRAQKLDERTARIAFELIDPHGALKSAWLRVNGVPAEIPVAAKGSYSGQLTIALSAGPNRIELSSTNAAGVESLRDVTVIESTLSARGKLWFLGVGVSSYRDDSLSLRYPADDARAAAATFAGLRGFNGVETILVTDAEATKAGIGAALMKLGGATEDDTVVFFFAGHGAPLGGELMLAPHDLDVTRSGATTVPFSDVEAALAKVRARKRLVLLDACHSGAEGTESAGAARSPNVRRAGARGLVLEDRGADTPSPSGNLVFSNVDRERFLFSDFASRSGAVVLSSSRGDEVSLELDEVRHGAFTSALVRAFGPGGADANDDGVVSGVELRSFLSSEVARLTGDLQHPVADRDVVGGSFALPSSGAGARSGQTVDPVTGFPLWRR